MAPGYVPAAYSDGGLGSAAKDPQAWGHPGRGWRLDSRGGVGGSSPGHGSPSTIQILVATGGRVWSLDPGKRGLGALQTV